MEWHRCSIDDIDEVFEKHIAMPYTQEVREGVKNGVRKTARDMAKLTRQTANEDIGWASKGFPDARKGVHGVFRKHITWRGEEVGIDSYRATWYVRSPEYRLTHLLVGGHKLVLFGKDTGKRTKSHDWLHKAHAKAEVDLVTNVTKELSK